MKKFFIFLFLFSCLFSYSNLYAQNNTQDQQDVYSRQETYEHVSSFSGVSTSTTFENTDTGGIATVVNYLLTMMAVAIIVLIVFRVIQGAVIKGTLESIYKQVEGRSFIQNAGIALVIFIFSYAILSFINPRLTGWTLATRYAESAFRKTYGRADVCDPSKQYTNTDPIEMLLLDEGYRNKIYIDTAGKMSIGVGFNLERSDKVSVKNDLKKAGISEDIAQRLVNGDRGISIKDDEIRKLLTNDFEAHKEMAIQYAGGQSTFDRHPEYIRNILINMTFNMGSGGIGSFKNMKIALDAALDSGNYFDVAKEIVDSKYCSDVGDRCSRLANLADPKYCVEYQKQIAASRSTYQGTTGSWPGVSINDTVEINGVRVGKSIESKTKELFSALTAAGIDFKETTNWRTYEKQVELRKTNGCPDIIHSPSGHCRVPTAKPGTSRHEAGVAFDFKHNGKTLCFPNATCPAGTNRLYDWLVANAADYGFYKLSTEAWHWSIDGK